MLCYTLESTGTKDVVKVWTTDHTAVLIEFVVEDNQLTKFNVNYGKFLGANGRSAVDVVNFFANHLRALNMMPIVTLAITTVLFDEFFIMQRTVL